MNQWLRRRALADRVAAWVLWPVVAPALLVIEWLIRRADGELGIIALPRVGQGGRIFRMYKLRSMQADRGDRTANGPSLAGTNDPRVTPIGRHLRKWHIDELPQVYNVLRGDMTFCGPRPEATDLVNIRDPLWADVLSVRPGVAGPTQIAFSDWERQMLLADDRDRVYADEVLPVKLCADEWYVREASPRIDAQVFLALVCRFLGNTLRRATRARILEIPSFKKALAGVNVPVDLE